jgi:hypothetical protein
MDIKEQDILGDKIGEHWYYRAKGAALRSMIGAAPVHHILDVGAGSGFFSRLLLDHGAAEATCVDPAYPADHEELHHDHPIRFVRHIYKFDGDLLLLMDVLEHVDDDVALLTEYVEKSPSRARFFITVPAFQWMWSGHDVFLEHRRRYTLPQMEAVIAKSGLTLECGCYYYGFTLPLAAATRLAGRLMGVSRTEPKSDLQLHAPLTNTALAAICTAELPFFKHNRLAGLTVCCLAMKP